MSYPPLSIRPHPQPVRRPEFVRLANRIAGHRRSLAFQWNGRTVELVFSALDQPLHGAWTLGLELGGHPLNLVLSRLPEIAWISPTLAGIDLRDLPEELACGLIEACFGEILDALAKQGVDVRVTSAQPLAPTETVEECLQWSLNRGEETGWMHGHLHGADAALEHLATLLQRVRVCAQPQEEHLPVALHFIAADLHLPLAELRRVALHDVLLADGKPFLAGRVCQIHAGPRVLGEATMNQQTFTLTHLHPATPLMDAAPANPALHDFDDLEIHLTFSVGSTVSTVGELRGLAPGFVFELPHLAGEGVSILANGKVIGKGEWIEVGGRTGIRVTELQYS